MINRVYHYREELEWEAFIIIFDSDGDSGTLANVQDREAFRHIHYVDDSDEESDVKVVGETLKKPPDFMDLEGSEEYKAS
ncbi:UNVERIFIED_CONTAM: hypothetical protein Sradi_3232800 [Sesamum radiatum]|uniref:Uncharacterized protein n=1 Tax=Sesamum radiatum TaxID=300843 RepID=A0AAW2RGT8_SESRA